jgi:hypothetical protein
MIAHLTRNKKMTQVYMTVETEGKIEEKLNDKIKEFGPIQFEACKKAYKAIPSKRLISVRVVESKSRRTKAWLDYQNIVNEGGEGINPHKEFEGYTVTTTYNV